MEINSVGRFCDSCAKSVVDFSSKSDEEIKNYLLARKDEKICGRFYKQQVNRIRIELDQRILYTEIPYWQKFLAILLVCFGQDVFGYDFCFAQEQTDSIPTKTELIDSISVIQEDSLLVETVVANDTIDVDSTTYLWETMEFISYELGMVSITCEPGIVMGSITIPEPEIPIVTQLEIASIPKPQPGINNGATSKPLQPTAPKPSSDPQKTAIALDNREPRKRRSNRNSA